MNGKEFCQRTGDYHAPTISRISVSSERGFAISFDDDDLFFGDPGAAGGDLFDDVIIEF